MRFPKLNLLLVIGFAGFISIQSASADELSDAVKADYDQHLAALFDFFHRNPELSSMEVKTAARLAEELRATGFEVTEGVGGTGIVAILKNGPGPQIDWDGNEVPVMHACGHDVHITSLVGTARIMAATRDTWSGTLMLIGQPAEERVGGAKKMMADNLWERFGKPDYALAFHVASGVPTGKLVADMGSPMSGADTVDIIVHGVGSHGASPHRGIDPVVLGSEIVLALQTIVSRELAPREAGVITVGSFHAGTKHNIISDVAHLQLTVRNDNFETREVLLNGIRRVAENMGRVAGLPEDMLPEVIVSDESVPPTMNDPQLTQRLRTVWSRDLGEGVFYDTKRQGMGAEDFPFFTTDPYIPSTYFSVGGTPQADFDAEEAGGPSVPSHHSPLFKIKPQESVTLGVEATVIALRDLLQVIAK